MMDHGIGRPGLRTIGIAAGIVFTALFATLAVVTESLAAFVAGCGLSMLLLAASLAAGAKKPARD